MRAAAIPDAAIREDALSSLESKRNNTEGAALFWILPRRRNVRLLRLLVTYEVMSDFLDSADERAAHPQSTNGRQLHLALVEALDPESSISDYLCLHPWREDAGYLRALVEACREGCSSMPSYASVRPFAIRAAELGQVQALNHEPDPSRRDAQLREWAGARGHQAYGLSWFELTAAGSAWLTVLALFAVAAEPECGAEAAGETYDAYFPWLSLNAAMLDSYADLIDDSDSEGHSYLSHYPSSGVAVERLRELLRRSGSEANALSNSHRHLVIFCCMVAMYLSKDSSRTPAMRADTRRLADASGSLTRLLLPILRMWRIVYSQRSA